MADTKDGGPAFPSRVVTEGGGLGYPGAEISRWAKFGDHDGMSLRDYFAGQALIGFIVSHPAFEIGSKCSEAAGWAYEMADAMLAMREVTHV